MFSSLQFQINGKQCGVTPSQDSDTLYLGNICKTWKKEAVSFSLGLFLAAFDTQVMHSSIISSHFRGLAF